MELDRNLHVKMDCILAISLVLVTILLKLRILLYSHVRIANMMGKTYIDSVKMVINISYMYQLYESKNFYTYISPEKILCLRERLTIDFFIT